MGDIKRRQVWGLWYQPRVAWDGSVAWSQKCVFQEGNHS